MICWDCLWRIGLFYSYWSYEIRQSQLDKPVFALRRLSKNVLRSHKSSPASCPRPANFVLYAAWCETERSRRDLARVLTIESSGCKGASIYDVRKIFGFFDPPSPFIQILCTVCPQIWGIFLPSPSPLCADVIYGSPLAESGGRTDLCIICICSALASGLGSLRHTRRGRGITENLVLESTHLHCPRPFR